MKRSFVRFFLGVLAVPLLAACDDDGTGVDRLTPEEVQGTYAVCNLLFDPTQQLLPTVDLRERAFSPTPAAALRLSAATREFELEFTPRNDVVDREIRGSFVIEGSAGVELRVNAAASEVTAASLLLPPAIDLNFTPTPQALVVAPSVEYNVPRADYARLAEISESGLASQIPGRLTAQFRVGGCG